MRKPLSVSLAALAVALATLAPAQAADPLALHPKNPRYLTFRGKATVLVGSGEHYGAVVNRDFDSPEYLDTLAADGLEPHPAPSWGPTTRSPATSASRRTRSPRRRAARSCRGRAATRRGRQTGGRSSTCCSGTPPTSSACDPSWPRRASEASSSRWSSSPRTYGRGWPHSPMNAANNVNGVGTVPKEKAQTLDNGNLLAEPRVVRKIVAELKDFDNVYYEIQNEPWADHERTRRRGERVRSPRGRGAAGHLLEEPGGSRGTGVARVAGAGGRGRHRGGGAPRRPAPRRPELLQPSIPRPRRRPRGWTSSTTRGRRRRPSTRASAGW